jgi:hypothetical protein
VKRAGASLDDAPYGAARDDAERKRDRAWVLTNAQEQKRDPERKGSPF